MKNNILTMLVGAATLLAVSCSKDDASTNYVSLSDSVYSFNYSGGNVTITVNTSEASWRAECSANWLTLSQNGYTLEVNALANSNPTDRSTEITIIAGTASANLQIFQNGNDNIPVIYRQIHGIPSINGYYEAGLTFPYPEAGDTGDTYFNIIINDMRNDKILTYGPFSKTQFPLVETLACDDNGNAYFTENLSGTAGNVWLFNRQDGSLSPFDTKTHVEQTNTSVVVGYKSEVGMAAEARPYKWVNGEAIALETPETSCLGQTEFNLIARGISADGKIIVGNEWVDTDMYATYWDESGKFHYVGEDVREPFTEEGKDQFGNEATINLCNGFFNLATKVALSPSGKWYVAWYRVQKLKDDKVNIENTYYPAFYNFEEGKSYICWDYPKCRAVAVTDDGIGIIATDREPFNGDPEISDYYAIDVFSGTQISSAQDFVYNLFGIYIPQRTYIKSFSEDGKVMIADLCYIVDRR